MTKRELRDEILKLKYRIADLEERLCPCEEHDWKQVDYSIVDICCGMDCCTVYKYKCKRCGKLRESWD